MIYEGERDVVVAFISSKVPRTASNAEVIVSEQHPEYALTGLKVASVIKLDKLATLEKLLLGEIGTLGMKLRSEVGKRIREAYRL